jgi:hypothetical protein
MGMSNKIEIFIIMRDNTYFSYDAGDKPLLSLRCVNKHLV